MKPNVAVIMCVYRNDNPRFIRDAIDSLLSQSYKSIDVYIYRDGLVDASIEEVLTHYEKLENIFVSRGNAPMGLAFGLNILINLVVDKGGYRYCARMDADDICIAQRIDTQVQFMENRPDVDVSGTSCREFGASFALDEKHLPKEHSELLEFSIVRCPFIHPSVMFRTKVFNTGVRYPVNTSLTEDMALWFDLLVKGYRFANVNELLISYRLDENTISRRKGIYKALSEVKIRLIYMVKLRRVSLKSTFLIFSRFVFHLLPDSVMRFAYKHVR
ncbi:glycosyltransferase [Vibrio mimicus]|uniref:Putative glycosyltransferase n=1 Tax=Vibrio mimicus VM603 TaxID=671074 RepID=D2YGE6_VIBMI|nr:glycosyltransferase [Vibrio mimicus]EEW06183.1 Putative glycosyltransferase [Vibrio mimicus VM603]